jgi:plastocyanin
MGLRHRATLRRALVGAFMGALVMALAASGTPIAGATVFSSASSASSGSSPGRGNLPEAPGSRSPEPAGPTVQAGINDPRDPQITVLEFMPARIRVTAGTPVTWTWEGAIEPHSVTFVPAGVAPPSEATLGDYLARRQPAGPYDGTTVANSGLEPLVAGADAPPFTLSFASPGVYRYFCAIHPTMRGTVEVVARGRATETAEAVRLAGRAQEHRWLAEGRAAKRRLDRSAGTSSRNADGTRTWTVEMGTTTKHTDVLAFAPTPKRVRPGDSIEFVNRSRTPHTATFPGGQAPITDPIAPGARAAIPGPSPQTLNTTDLFNTGELSGTIALVPGEPAPERERRRFTFVVPDAGQYRYYCIFHVASGMGGTVVARERGPHGEGPPGK